MLSLAHAWRLNARFRCTSHVHAWEATGCVLMARRPLVHAGEGLRKRTLEEAAALRTSEVAAEAELRRQKEAEEVLLRTLVEAGEVAAPSSPRCVPHRHMSFSLLDRQLRIQRLIGCSYLLCNSR